MLAEHLARVRSFALLVRDDAVVLVHRHDLRAGHARRLEEERDRADDIDDDAPCCAVLELLDEVDRVLCCAETGEPLGCAVRELRRRVAGVERLAGFVAAPVAGVPTAT